MKWLYSSALYTALATSLFFTGCGEDTPEACAYGVEQDLDQGRYDDVISTLASDATCEGEMTTDESNTALAAAYMAKAGLTLGELAATILDSTESDPMAAFMTAFSDKANSEVLQSLSNADAKYALVIGDVDCDDNTTVQTSTVSSACFYQNLASTVQTVTVMAAAFGDSITDLGAAVTTGSADDVNDNGSGDEMEVTGCSIADASVANSDGTCSETTITYTDTAAVTFTDGTNSVGPVIPRTFSVADINSNNGGAVTFNRMIDQGATVPSPVTTNELCTTSFVTCTTVDMTACFPCPVVVDGGTVETTSVILDAVNTGAVEGVTPSDLEQSCVDAGGACTLDGDFDAADLAIYMTLQ